MIHLFFFFLESINTNIIEYTVFLLIYYFISIKNPKFLLIPVQLQLATQLGKDKEPKTVIIVRLP